MASAHVCSQSLLQDWYKQSSEPRGCSAVSIFQVFKMWFLKRLWHRSTESRDLYNCLWAPCLQLVVLQTKLRLCPTCLCFQGKPVPPFAGTWHGLFLCCRYEKDIQLFKSKVVDSVKLCSSHLFDQPKIEDPYAIVWVLRANRHLRALTTSSGIVFYLKPFPSNTFKLDDLFFCKNTM